MNNGYKSRLVVDLLLTRKNQNNEKEVLLSLRKNTGSHDGEYELPGGHVEEGEDLIGAMIREAKEELGIDIKEEDLNIIHILHNYIGNRVNFILFTNKYTGELKVNEPDKCEKLEWFTFNKLPDNITKKVKNTLKEIENNILYDSIEFKRINN